MSNITLDSQGAALIAINKIIIRERLRTETPEHTRYIEEELAPSIKLNGVIQPIVLNALPDGTFELIAGESRLLACKLIGRTEIPYVTRDNLNRGQLHQLEIEENVRRKAMTWQQTAIGIYKTHKLRSEEAAMKIGTEEYSEWTQRATGQLLNLARSQVTSTLTVAEALLNGDTELLSQPTFDGARKVLLARKQKAVNAKLHEHHLDSFEVIPATNPAAAPQPIMPQGLVNLDALPTRVRTIHKVNLSGTILQGECVSPTDPSSGLLELLKPESFDLIITDIPYGIEMDSLDVFDIKLVEAEHDVEENLAQMPLFARGAYRVLKPGSYCIFFYAMEHHSYLVKLGQEAGFSVQPWPLTWHKLSSVKNSAPGQWWPKNQEFAMVWRKGKGTLKNAQLSSVFSFSSDSAKKKFGHPFSKPEELVRAIIEPLVIPGMNVLDPYAGRGSMGCAALSMGTKVTMIEKQDEHYAALVQNVKSAYAALLPDKELQFV